MRPLLVPGFIPASVSLFDVLARTIPWVQMDRTPRRESFMAVDTTLRYSYGNDPANPSKVFDAAPMPPAVLRMMEALNAAYGAAYNVAVGNYYEGKRQHLGWHADNSPEQDPEHPIAVLSFGATRDIWIKAVGAKGVVPKEDRFTLEPGSLFIMPGGFQAGWLHCIPKHDRDCDPRVSLTFRKLDRSASPAPVV